MSITITIPPVAGWGGVASAARAPVPLITALLLPVLEEAAPAAGAALTLARLVRIDVLVGQGQPS